MKTFDEWRGLVRHHFQRSSFVDRKDATSLVHRFPMVLIAVFVAAGIAIDTAWFRSAETSGVIWGSVAFSAIVSILVVARSHHQWMPNVVSTLSLSMIVASAGGAWHAACEDSYRSASVLNFVRESGDPVVVRGELDATVSLRKNPFARRGEDVSSWQSQLQLELDSIRIDGLFESISGKVLVYVDGDLSHHRPGDQLEVFGWLYAFERPTNPGENDRRESFRRRGLHGRIETKDSGAVSLLAPTDRWISPLIADIARSGRESLMRHTDEKTGALAVALVVGQREFVDIPTRDALLATGTAHLLSVSGMHLAIIVLVITWIVSGLGLSPLSRLIVIVSMSALYVAVTGGRPPVIRAAVLISMLLVSTFLHRPSQPLNTLGLAAIFLMVLNPMNVFSIGVHLSFMAVVTLMLVGRNLSQQAVEVELQRERDTGFDAMIEQASGRRLIQLKSILGFFAQMGWLSLCVTAVSLPLVWSQFHLISLVSVATNVLVWGGLMLALPSGVLTVMIDPISSSLASIPGTVCHYALAYMWSMIAWTKNWPGGHFWLPAPSTASIWIFYAVLTASLFWKSSRIAWWRRGWIVAWTITAVFLATRPASLPDQTLEATFIDVGHGTSVIIRTPDQKVWLYDCGRMGNDLGTSRHIDTALWSLGITRLEAVFLSHADADHYNALPAILERFSVKQLITPPGMLETDEVAIATLRQTIDAFGIPVREVACEQLDFGMSIESDGMSILHPPVEGVSGNDNANSLVLMIENGDQTLLLPGDLEPPGTEILTSMPRPSAGGVLMAPHHGSLSMNADAVLAWARPAETIVSGGSRAARPEVAEMLSLTGSGVHVTADQGAIRVRINRTGATEIRSWRQSPWSITR